MENNYDEKVKGLAYAVGVGIVLAFVLFVFLGLAILAGKVIWWLWFL